MAQYDLTPKNKIVPGVASWGNTPTEMPVVGQDNTHVHSLRELEREFHVRVRLDSIDIHKTAWQNELMQAVYVHSYPLKEIIMSKTTVKITKEWLGYWEILSQTVIPGLSKRMEQRKQAATDAARKRAEERKKDKEVPVTLRGLPIRSFHIRDNHSSSIQSLQRAINRVEFETGARLNWDWMATYSSGVTDSDKTEIAKNNEKWSIGVDGEGAINVANMRAWKNKIATGLKVADIIIGNDESEDDYPSEIAFALMNLAAGGYSIIRIPRIASSATVSMIHLFAQCFECTTLRHTVADDRMYLCGEGFLDNLTTKHHKLLYEYCDVYPGNASTAPFTREYITGEPFSETLDKLMEVNREIQHWRYEYYERLLITYTKLYKSTASKTFTDYIDNVLTDTYKDQSSKWIAATGFNFFAQEQ